MPGVPSSPADGPRPDGPDPSDGEGEPRQDDRHEALDRADSDLGEEDVEDDPDENAHADDLDRPEDPWLGLPRRLWTSILFVAIQAWFVLGALLLTLEAFGAPVPPAVTDARSIVPWVPQDVWSVLADVGWIVLVSVVVAALLRRRLGLRGTWPLPATADLTVLVAIAVGVAMAGWPAVFPDVSWGVTAVGAMLLTILLLRLREVYVGRDLIGPWGRRRAVLAVLVPVLLVAAYAAWHPLVVPEVTVRVGSTSSVSGGQDSTDADADDDLRAATTDGDAVQVETGPGRTVRLSVTIQAATGGIRLLDAAPVVPDGVFRVLPARRPGTDAARDDGSPLPDGLEHRGSVALEFRLRGIGRCDGHDQRIDRLRVRYRRLGRTITTELATDAPVTLACTPDR